MLSVRRMCGLKVTLEEGRGGFFLQKGHLCLSLKAGVV